MANALKEQIITFNDANVAIQLFKFECRKPGVPSKKYEFKSFDDVMVSPMALFYPHVFVDQQLDEHAKSILLGKISPNKPIRDKRLFTNIGKYEGFQNDNPESLLQQFQENGELISNMDKVSDIMDYLVLNPTPTKWPESEKDNTQKQLKDKTTLKLRKNMTPLDKAIIESITMAGFTDQSRADKLYSNILLIGGGCKIEGLDEILLDRLYFNRPQLLGCNKLEELCKQVIDWKSQFEKRRDEAYNKQQLQLKENGGVKPEGFVAVDKTAEFELSKEQEQELSMIANASTTSSTAIKILSSSKEIDPGTLGWKGGSVFARLKIVEELWINEDDWDRLGSRTLNYISLFNY
ncbi:unnamed protein product [Ambrosiozyma monospora]|uniref:Unnamed protein product n=2 Tax=Ambrosiozyma monospora TaxID=43982 RepID=A0ACB5UC74_AMBMO|nr:unnamed protein product [Ambrosiozyma monospora]